MKAIVTGGAGFIGSALVHALLRHKMGQVVVYDKLTYAGRLENLVAVANDPNYRFVRGDILDGAHFRAILAQVQPDVVFHLAAESHVDRSLEDDSEFIRTNVEGTTRLLNDCNAYVSGLNGEVRQCFRFVHVSTDEVFGALGKQGVFNENSPYRPNSPYAASKAASDMMARSYFQTFGFPVVITNCSNNYGPRQFPEKLIPLCLTRALNGQNLPVYGTGAQIRDWLHVDDHVDALITVAQCAVPGSHYCVGGGAEMCNLDTVKAMCSLLDMLRPRAEGPHHDLITFVEDRKGHDFRYAVDGSKIANELGWQPKRSFAEGLEATVLWYLENTDWLKAVIADVTNATNRQGLSRRTADRFSEPRI